MFLRAFGLMLVWLMVGLLTTCRKGESLSVSAYNDRIVAELERASRRMSAYYAISDPEITQLDALQNYLNAARERILNLPPYQGDAAFRDEAIQVLDFYERLCKEQSRSLLNLTQDGYYTIEDSLLVRRIVASILVEEYRYNSRLLERQKEFAREHGLLLIKE